MGEPGRECGLEIRLGFGDGGFGVEEVEIGLGSSYERMLVSEEGRYVGRSFLGGGEGLSSGEDVFRRLGGIDASLSGKG